MIGLEAAIGYLLAVALVGFLWALVLSGRRGALSPLMALAVSFPLGSLATTWTWLVALVAGFKLEASVVLVSFLVHISTAGIVAGFRRARLRKDSALAPGAWGMLDIAALLVLAGILVYQCWTLAVTPYNGDGLGFWRPKAHILAAEGTVRSPFFTHPDVMHTNRRYPLLVPFTQAGLKVMDRDGSGMAERTVYPAFLLSIFLMAYVGLRRACSPSGAILLLLMLSMATLGKLQAGYVTAPMAAYLLGTLVFVLRWCEAERPGSWLPAALLAAGMVFTKAEGLLYFCLITPCLGLTFLARGRRRQWLPLLFFVTVTGLVSLPWLMFRHSLPETYVIDLASYLSLEHLTGSLVKAPYVFTLLGLEVFSFQSWGFLWLLAFWAFFTAKAPLVLRVFPAAALLIWLVVTLVIPIGLSWCLYTTDRFLLQMAMPALLLAARGITTDVQSE